MPAAAAIAARSTPDGRRGLLHAGFAVTLVVERDDGQVRRPLTAIVASSPSPIRRSPSPLRTMVTPLGLRQREPETEWRADPIAPHMGNERVVAGGRDVPLRRAQTGDDQQCRRVARNASTTSRRRSETLARSGHGSLLRVLVPIMRADQHAGRRPLVEGEARSTLGPSRRPDRAHPPASRSHPRSRPRGCPDPSGSATG